MNEPRCAKCKTKPCKNPPEERKTFPPYCPLVCYPDLIKDIKSRYRDSEIFPYYLKAAVTERECYDPSYAGEGKIRPLRPRIREVAAFAEKLRVKKAGLAFCSGLSDEAARADTILKNHGLDVVSVCCSCGGVDKTELEIPSREKIYGEDCYEPACNPLLQAEILNRSETAFNVMVGLCIGHDMLFTKASQAPVTTLIVKDRFTGHNPVISLYSRYHKDMV